MGQGLTSENDVWLSTRPENLARARGKSIALRGTEAGVRCDSSALRVQLTDSPHVRLSGASAVYCSSTCNRMSLGSLEPHPILGWISCARTRSRDHGGTLTGHFVSMSHVAKSPH